MTLQSKSAQSASAMDNSRVEKTVIESIEQANASLSDDVLSEIAQARINAIKLARQQASDGNLRHRLRRQLSRITDWLRQQIALDNLTLAAPLAVAVVVTVLVSYDQSNPIPALPAEILAGDVPTEELAMLEELEFASWLAEQQQEGLL